MGYETHASGIVDHALLQNMYEGYIGHGFVSGGVVTSAGVDLETDYTGFTAYINGVVVTVAGGAVTHDAAHATLPRQDMVVCDNAGTVSIIKGTATAESSTIQSKPPLGTLPAGSLILATVYLAALDAVIADATIFDRRVMAFDRSPAATITFDNDLDVNGQAAIGSGASVQNQVALTVDQVYEGSSAPAQVAIHGSNELDGNSVAYGLLVQPDGMTVQTGVTASILASVRITEPLITLEGTGAVTMAASLYISSAPTEAPAGSNYSIFADAGVARFDGDGTHIFEFPADATDPTGGGGAATGQIPVQLGGSTFHLAYY